jgi:thiamine-monophosphate kinase
VTSRLPTGARTLSLGPGPEFDRIRDIIQLLGPQGGALGDDCALIPAGETVFALSTDVSVERVHFRLDWISLADVGWRASAAALSDLAAEGADPVGILCAVTVPSRAAAADLLEVISGVRDAAQSFGALVLGGDLSSGSEWSLAITVIGQTRSPVTRGGAVPGDSLWITGALGGSRAALESWRRGATPPPASRQRYARPVPRIAAGRWLAEHGARAMIDLSDGLAGDAGHLAAASGVAVEIDLDGLPLAREAEQEAVKAGISAGQFAAEGGEDFELLAAMPPEFDGAAAFARECGIPLTRIGSVVEGSGVRLLDGGRVVTVKSFDHFG